MNEKSIDFDIITIIKFINITLILLFTYHYLSISFSILSQLYYVILQSDGVLGLMPKSSHHTLQTCSYSQ